MRSSHDYEFHFNLDEESDAFFYRDIKASDQLPGVDPKLKGIERAKAYAQTEEYSQLKSIMLSLKKSKASSSLSAGSSSASPSAKVAEGNEADACIGAEYTYDLASGVSCEDAKSTWATLLRHRPSTGGVENLEIGTCSLGEYEMKDGKIVAESGECRLHSGGEFSFKHK